MNKERGKDMKLLEDRIAKDGKVVNSNVIKVESFLNHQIDTKLIYECGKEWYEKFKDQGITKILTIDGSGIGIASITALQFGVPVLFARKLSADNKVGSEFFSAKIVSLTHGHEYNVIAGKRYLSKNDKVLIIDDFLANGSAMKALITLCNTAGATVVGCGAVIEKVFRNGGNDIRRSGIRVESLAKISSMSEDGNIEFC